MMAPMQPAQAQQTPPGPDPNAGQPQPDPQAQAQAPDPAAGPPQPPQDPNQVLVQAILSMPSPEAIHHVYTIAASAAKAKTQLLAAGTSLNARQYQQILSKSPEVRYVKELVQAKQELDKLAGERRRLNTEAVKARKAGNAKRASTYEMQSVQAEDAMGHVAAGVLMFLMVPASALDPNSQQQPTPQPDGPSDPNTTQSPQPQSQQLPGGPAQ